MGVGFHRATLRLHMGVNLQCNWKVHMTRENNKGSFVRTAFTEIPQKLARKRARDVLTSILDITFSHNTRHSDTLTCFEQLETANAVAVAALFIALSYPPIRCQSTVRVLESFFLALAPSRFHRIRKALFGVDPTSALGSSKNIIWKSGMGERLTRESHFNQTRLLTSGNE